jgi:hypothetical protein
MTGERATLAERAEAIAAGDLVVPIQRTYPLDNGRAAFTELEADHGAGTIVLKHAVDREEEQTEQHDWEPS